MLTLVEGLGFLFLALSRSAKRPFYAAEFFVFVGEFYISISCKLQQSALVV